MALREFYSGLPLDERLKRLARTPDDLAAAIAGRDAAELARRPDAQNWSPTEIICHLRDIEEICMMRFRTMLAMDNPKVLVVGARPTPRNGASSATSSPSTPPAGPTSASTRAAIPPPRSPPSAVAAASRSTSSTASRQSNGNAAASIPRSAGSPSPTGPR